MEENNDILITKEQSNLIANIIEYLAETLGAVNNSMNFIQDPQFKLNHQHVRQLRKATKSLQGDIVVHNDMLLSIAAVLRNPDNSEMINSFFDMTEAEKEQLKKL